MLVHLQNGLRNPQHFLLLFNLKILFYLLAPVLDKFVVGPLGQSLLIKLFILLKVSVEWVLLLFGATIELD